jgi:hypothetical protein
VLSAGGEALWAEEIECVASNPDLSPIEMRRNSESALAIKVATGPIHVREEMRGW